MSKAKEYLNRLTVRHAVKDERDKSEVGNQLIEDAYLEIFREKKDKIAKRFEEEGWSSDFIMNLSEKEFIKIMME